MSYQVSFCFWLLTYEQNIAQQLNKCVFDLCRKKHELNFVIESTTSSLSWLKLPSQRWRKKWYVSSLPLSEYDSFPGSSFFWEYLMDHDFCYRTLSPKHLLTISLPCLSLNFYHLWKISRNANGQMRILVETFSFWRKNWPLISRILRMFFTFSLSLSHTHHISDLACVFKRTYDEYISELASGHLSWTPVHESDDFWKENATKLNEKDHEQLKSVGESVCT